MRNKQFRRRILSTLLCVSLAAAMLPATAISVLAEEVLDSSPVEGNESNLLQPGNMAETVDPVQEEETEEELLPLANAMDNYQETLTEWKIAPSAAGTTCGLPAIDDWNVDAADQSQ